jgi:hypothetical protein
MENIKMKELPKDYVKKIIEGGMEFEELFDRILRGNGDTQKFLWTSDHEKDKWERKHLKKLYLKVSEETRNSYSRYKRLVSLKKALRERMDEVRTKIKNE